ncbi:MAG: hypothetical protein CSYNP_00492 [Syntrophus sp. SKADARSKE-3]|nr:hypothetical protein [Syntrophus sp. SKADARSKE-3]
MAEDKEIYDELSRLNNELVNLQRKLAKKNAELQAALDRIETLQGFLPICSYCKMIRTDNGNWMQIEAYISRHSKTEFSHGICPECLKKYFPEMDEN